MALKLYRRHNTSCVVHTLSLQPNERRYYMDCDCPLWIAGTYGDSLLPRHSLGTTDLKTAEAMKRAFMADAADEKVHGIRVRDAIKRFLTATAAHTAPGTVALYQRLLGYFETYCNAHSLVFMTELNVDCLEDFQVTGLPKLKDSTRAMQGEYLRIFLRAAFRREWIQKPLAERIQRFYAAGTQRLPFTEDEVRRLLAEASKPLPTEHTRYYARPETFRLLLELMLETGMRVSDAVRFDVQRLARLEGGLWAYSFEMQKSRRGRAHLHTVYLRDALRAQIISEGKDRPFWIASISRPELVVHHTVKRLGNRCGVGTAGPHRFRHTYARRMLMKGVSLSDLSRLLGHSSVRVTESHYAAWVPERAARLQGIAALALSDPLYDALGNANNGAPAQDAALPTKPAPDARG